MMDKDNNKQKMVIFIVYKINYSSLLPDWYDKPIIKNEKDYYSWGLQRR